MMLEDLTPPGRTYACKVRTVAEGLEPKDKDILIAAVNNPDWNFKTLSNELAKRGITIVDTGIAKHRRKQCACFRN
jgi:5,10-methylene-tetrahydrofolate dehydrogenase/methenyl tetrahydrofolate cyclohydrolase